MTKSNIAADYYLANENARIAALTRRVAALERTLGIVAARIVPKEGTAVAMPDALLPAASEIPELLILDREGLGIYRVEGEVVGDPLGDKFALHFIYIGQAREAETLVEMLGAPPEE